MFVSWYGGKLRKGKIHRAGKKDISFDSMFGKYALEYENPETGHAYHDPEYSYGASNLSKEEAEKEIHHIFVAPYACRIAEYKKVLDTLPPVKWRQHKGEDWLSPVLHRRFSPLEFLIKKRLSRG